MEPITNQGTTYFLQAPPETQKKVLCIQGDAGGFRGENRDGVFQCPLTAENAAALRARLPWLNPQPLGLAASFGFGDRMGIATPGHVAAVRGTNIMPIFAQQSVRENNRTGRSPQIVLNDAMWAVFEHDWRQPWGADADHVKEIADLPPFISAGYSFYTIDPNLHVDNQAQTDSEKVLADKAYHLPWDRLEDTLQNVYQRYLTTPIQLEHSTFIFQEIDLLRALAKYGKAIAHIKSISDYLIAHVNAFDLEASVDETDTPTSVLEHFFLANELRRLDVPFVSLAPRFIGSFEKGVDYIGDLVEFEKELSKHAEVMHHIGGYKMSIHTGSDKFSIYPFIAQYTKNLVHVKTAGTSYLEALKVVATADIALFREILDFARQHFETDKASYHISGQLNKVPAADSLGDAELISLFDDFDARQVLHVTFGSVLDKFRSRLFETVNTHAGEYEEFLKSHFKRHLAPFRFEV
jgi:hypothetical protein